MSKGILSELKLLRSAVVQLAGGSGLPEDIQLSPEVLDKAAEDFKRLRTMNDKWIPNYDLDSYFKIENPHYNVGSFIIEHFKFTNYFKYRRSYYFNKTDIISLAKELKARNVNLSRYIDFKLEETIFIQKVQTAFDNKKASKDMPYWLSDMVRDVEVTQSPRPSVEIVEADITDLKKEFSESKLGKYIDVYHGTYAMVKIESGYKKYISDDIRKQCSKWCQNWNYALNALKIIDEMKASQIEINNDNEIEL